MKKNQSNIEPAVAAIAAFKPEVKLSASEKSINATAAMDFFQQKILVVYHLRLGGLKPKEIYAEMTENGITTTLSSVRAFIKTIKARYEQES